MNLLSLGASAHFDSSTSPGPATGRVRGHAQYELSVGAFASRELEVISFQGSENLNSPFVYDIVFASSVPPALLQAGVFGFPASLSIHVPQRSPQVIQGLAVSFESIGAAESELNTHTRRYMTRVVPRLWLLNHSRKYRVFQRRSAIQVACAVLEDAGITPEVRLERGEYPAIPFVYQRGETDLEFLHRILGVAGVFYYFEHATGLLERMLSSEGGGCALADGLGGLAAGAANLGAGNASFSGGFGGGLGSAMGTLGAALSGSTTLVLCDRARHTHAIQDASPMAAAGGVASAGIGTSGGVAAVALEAAFDAVGKVTDGLGTALLYDANGQAATAHERIFSFRTRAEVRPKQVTLRDWDVSQSTAVRMNEKSNPVTVHAGIDLSAAMSFSGSLSTTVGVDMNLTLDAIPIPTNDVSVEEYQRDAALLRGARDLFAEHALAQLRSDRVTAQGESDCRRLAPGYRFTLARHPIAPVNVEYVITAVRATGYAPDHLPAECPHLYQNAFSCVPTSVDPRPPKPAPRPPPGLESATVVGPEYGDVHCDSLGRILVRFHWADASHSFSETDPGVCWVNWLERWAGNGFGTMTLPRVGSEVLVAFPDHEGGAPFAIGQNYSRVNAPPFALPREAPTVGIRSAVLGDPGYSELAMDDGTGDVRLRAQRNFDAEVLSDAHLRVSRDRRVEVGGNFDGRTAGHFQSTVGGNVKTRTGGSHASHIEGDATSIIGGHFTVKAAGGVEADLGHLTPHLTGSLDLHVSGETRFVHQRSVATDVWQSDTKTIGGPKILTAEDLDASFSGTCSVVAGDILTLLSAKSIRLACGESEILMTPQGISIAAPTVEISGTKQLELTGAGPSLTLDSGFTVMSKTVTLQSSGARLALSDVAQLAGSKVKLGQGSGGSSQAPTSNASTHTVSVRLIDPTAQPLCNATYQATIADTMTQGTTDAAGHLSLTVPTYVTSLRVVVWPTTFPEGPRITYVVDVAPMADATSLDGAQRRLRNLGYYSGPTTGQMDVRTQDALLVFQRHSQIPLTGRLDDKTSEKLAAAHD